ncbi:MAG: hypothetical protein DRH11_16920 [Deltaproteobacteria bacterium]|nr:MAG: hypothetical protein DRH11_16920 [Deltaproteobacteria bacterium]
MEHWINLGRKLRELVKPSTMPVAVKFLKEENQIPEKARRPLRDLKVKMAPCQGSAMARLYGWTVAFTREDVGCAIASHTYGWERTTDQRGAIDFLTRMNYASDEKAAVELLAGFRLLELGDDLIVVYSPLERTKVEPDVVLIYVNPAQMMRLIHGATHHTGKPLTGSFSGRAASCTEGVIGSYLDNDAKVVVPGNGDRVWAACQDHEIVMAVHAERLAELVEGLEKTHKMGVRYPIPTYLRYQPEVAFTIPLSDIFKPEEVQKLG